MNTDESFVFNRRSSAAGSFQGVFPHPAKETNRATVKNRALSSPPTGLGARSLPLRGQQATWRTLPASATPARPGAPRRRDRGCADVAEACTDRLRRPPVWESTWPAASCRFRGERRTPVPAGGADRGARQPPPGSCPREPGGLLATEVESVVAGRQASQRGSTERRISPKAYVRLS
jgi:hypothetical protein